MYGVRGVPRIPTSHYLLTLLLNEVSMSEAMPRSVAVTVQSTIDVSDPVSKIMSLEHGDRFLSDILHGTSLVRFHIAKPVGDSESEDLGWLLVDQDIDADASSSKAAHVGRWVMSQLSDHGRVNIELLEENDPGWYWLGRDAIGTLVAALYGQLLQRNLAEVVPDIASFDDVCSMGIDARQAALENVLSDDLVYDDEGRLLT